MQINKTDLVEDVTEMFIYKCYHGYSVVTVGVIFMMDEIIDMLLDMSVSLAVLHSTTLLYCTYNT